MCRYTANSTRAALKLFRAALSNLHIAGFMLLFTLESLKVEYEGKAKGIVKRIPLIAGWYQIGEVQPKDVVLYPKAHTEILSVSF
jgi:hypothetical protein